MFPRPGRVVAELTQDGGGTPSSRKRFWERSPSTSPEVTRLAVSASSFVKGDLLTFAEGTNPPRRPNTRQPTVERDE